MVPYCIQTTTTAKKMLLQSYQNGNYSVNLYDDGTRIRESDNSVFDPQFPESIDLKITNWCDSNCPMCHEESNRFGKHSNLTDFARLWKDLPKGVEIAIGGGDPLSHPDIIEFLYFLNVRGIVANITVNSNHLLRHKSLLNNLIKFDIVKGLGISYNSSIPLETYWFAKTYPNVVIHLIIGIHTLQDVRDIFRNVPKAKILLLGYKKVGRGTTFYSPAIGLNIFDWYCQIHELFDQKNKIIAFDNLAIQQLNMRRFFRDETWQKFYQGDDGQFTFYVDLVKQEYACSSASEMRFQIKENDTFEIMFQNIKRQVPILRLALLVMSMKIKVFGWAVILLVALLKIFGNEQMKKSS